MKRFMLVVESMYEIEAEDVDDAKLRFQEDETVTDLNNCHYETLKNVMEVDND